MNSGNLKILDTPVLNFYVIDKSGQKSLVHPPSLTFQWYISPLKTNWVNLERTSLEFPIL